MTNIYKLLYCIFMTVLTLIIGAFLNNKGVDTWYQQLQKPLFTPPDYIFPIVWNIIYILIIISFYQSFIKANNPQQEAHINGMFLSQLLLHILWSFTFFYCGYMAFALIIVIVLNIFTIYCIYRLYSISPLSAWLLIPYQGWLLLAAWLNIGFVYLHGYTVNL